ncbi:hypothetical protein MKW98_010554 [Papaver atlanticum]|uniref:Serine/threonine-protein kinase BSK1-like TPR repeats domain-containing protein n=1 Tax=Papaver atlanticum TaxID=357466 RepID=A0AAD4S2I1_9MAGN|nr:hypothetical protein MKW98_010554 [Papaver atlanticum]
MKLDIDVKHNSGETPLCCAAIEGRLSTVAYLLKMGANPEIPNGHHDTIQKLLLNHNANPNWLFGEATTPLRASIYSKSWQCMENLLKAGADPNGGPDGMEALPFAAAVGTIPIIKLLVGAGAVTNTYGLKPVEVAARDVMEHVNSEKFKKMFREDNEIFFLDSKSRSTSAFRRKEYSLAVHWYTEALKTDPSDAAVLSNRSLCFVYLNKGNSALKDATQCVLARPDWPKAHYRKGVALKLLNRLDDAADAFLDGLKLDPENKELEAAFREVSLAG